MHQLTHDVQQRQQFFDQLCAAWSSEYRQRGGSIHCGEGCGGCCSLVVNCSFPEALRVAGALTAEHHSRLRDRVAAIQETADRSGDLKQWLAAYRRLPEACPFLNRSAACSIYPVRPFSCRSLLSTLPPDWCVTDFSGLTSEEKHAFMAALDRTSVAFPTHYAATPQEIGQELEEATLRQMETVYGFSITGSLPWLVWLEAEYQLSRLLPEGREAVQRYLAERQLLNQFLVVIL